MIIQTFKFKNPRHLVCQDVNVGFILEHGILSTIKLTLGAPLHFQAANKLKNFTYHPTEQTLQNKFLLTKIYTDDEN